MSYPSTVIPCPRRGHTAVVINNTQMYVFGGLHGATKYLNDMFVFNIETNEWQECVISNESIVKPEPRAWHTANVIFGDKILIFGGSGGRFAFHNDLWIFDTKNYAWNFVTFLSHFFFVCHFFVCLYDFKCKCQHTTVV